MSFGLKITSIIGKPALENRNKQLKDENSRLGQENARIIAVNKDTKFSKTKLEELKKDLDLMAIKLKTLQENNKLLENSLSQKYKEIEVAESELRAIKTATETELNTRQIKFNLQTDKFNQEISILDRKKQGLNNDINELNNNLIVIKDEITNNVNKLNDLVLKIDRAKKEDANLAGLTTTRENLENINSNLVQQNYSLDKRNKELIQQNSDYEIKIQPLKSDYDKIMTQIKLSQQTFDDYKIKEQLKLDKQAGDISEKITWLKDKEVSLRTAKAELEKFYNRKISHIII